jgi:hypothetical protein
VGGVTQVRRQNVLEFLKCEHHTTC